MHTLVLAIALGSSPALAQDAPVQAAPPAPTRLVLNTAVLGVGLGLVGAGAYNLTQAREAYADYTAQPASLQDDSILTQEVRPRQIAGIAELGAGALGLGVGTLMWATTDGLDAPGSDMSTGRRVLNTSVLGAGAGLGIAAVYNYGQARRVYGWYVAEEDEDRAARLYDQMGPMRVAAGVEGALAVACLGVGSALWLGERRVSLSAGPGHLGFEARW